MAKVLAGLGGRPRPGALSGRQVDERDRVAAQDGGGRRAAFLAQDATASTVSRMRGRKRAAFFIFSSPEELHQPAMERDGQLETFEAVIDEARRIELPGTFEVKLA